MDSSESAIIAERPSRAGLGKIDLKATKWFREARGISPETLAQLDVASGTTFFPEGDKKSPAVFFKYSQGWKARAFPEKMFVAGGELKREFWNLARVLRANPEAVYITEGELDAIALVEAGIEPTAVLGAHGAKDKPTEGDPADLPGYAYVLDALAAGLKRVKRFIWCGDADGPGLLLREDMVRILGAARFWFIDWPEGVKDANSMLISDGPEALLDLVKEGCLPWPVDGLFRLSELPEPAPMVLWDCGFPEWERKIMLAPKTLSVVTGHPGHGKTVLWTQIWFNVIRNYGIPFCGASFETRPKPHIRRQLRTLFTGALERELLDDEIRAADAWINESYFWLVHPENRPTLEWFLDKAEVAIVRHGCRIIQIDPWNRLEASRGKGETSEEYIGRCLRTCHQFANDMNVHVQILAHPAKMDGPRRGHAPLLEDIAGAKHWDNMPDCGFTVHRPKLFEEGVVKTEVDLHYRKARFVELGHPCKLKLDYDLKKGAYKSIDYKI
jgi:twinkle protein